jgi:hypothetical protein
MNDVNEHTTMRRFTKKEPKGGMTKESRRRVSLQETRYYFLIPG